MKDVGEFANQLLTTLLDLLQDFVNCLGCAFLHAFEKVAVGVQSDPNFGVPQPL